ncbi:hypothetical protein EV363DRAFT_739793 [Boletus edulis]|uniref:UPF0261 domain-containing protein n=1 Tax=Boletus edulis BED1 TaxID=1328754 RepID=A0AAD4C3E8_BOLED|nr:hypothetical protein EV363DRAFT_739793 [Boletus edulis]KAF8447799.1 hypothetical protein L210DRAFT_2818432 [Boletus edulis BED1]
MTRSTPPASCVFALSPTPAPSNNCLASADGTPQPLKRCLTSRHSVDGVDSDFFSGMLHLCHPAAPLFHVYSMPSTPVVAVVGTCDTKYEAFCYIKHVINASGSCKAILIDIGIYD